MKKLHSRHYLLLRVGVVVALIVGAKILIHYLGWEMISINPLFSGIVAANVFLMGFLLSGVLADYKESERIPGELAVSLENLSQEVLGIRLAHPEARVGTCLSMVAGLCRDVLAWLHKEKRTAALMAGVDGLTPQLALMEQWTQATLVARLKGEQANIRRIVVRIHTIRETSFVAAGYLLADVITTLMCAGLVLSKIEPFYESLFFVSVISCLMVFLLLLIRDLDNPFGYYERSSGEDVSLKPLEDALARIEATAAAEAAVLVGNEE